MLTVTVTICESLQTNSTIPCSADLGWLHDISQEALVNSVIENAKVIINPSKGQVASGIGHLILSTADVLHTGDCETPVFPEKSPLQLDPGNHLICL